MAQHELDGGYVAHELGDDGAPTADDIVAFWATHGVLSADERERRVRDARLVVTFEGVLVAVSTFVAEQLPRFRAGVWFQRIFIDPDHRGVDLSRLLALIALDMLEREFVAGRDDRAIGVGYQIENKEIARAFPMAVLPYVDAVYFGDTPHGDPVHVRWFDGALVP